MNRSLEALAIFAICLGGMLAVVRISTQDRNAASRNIAEGTKAVVPANGTGTAIESPARENCQLTYDAGCGLDRSEHQIYTPNRPLLSPREVALKAILSPPIPLFVLADESTNEMEVATGYDTVYDSSMCLTEMFEEAVARAETEAEYAAAQLAAADLPSAKDVELNDPFAVPSPVWNLLSGSLLNLRNNMVSGTKHLQRSYVDPAARAIENRWSNSEMPKMLRYPRAKADSRELLHRQRAESSERITWDDYLAFTERQLQNRTEESAEPRLAEQKRPRNVLWPR